MGAAARRVHPPGEEAGELLLEHVVEQREPGVVDAVVELRHHPVPLLQVHGRAIDGADIAREIFGAVLPPVQAVGLLGGRRVFFVVGLDRRLRSSGRRKVAGQDVVEEAVIRGPLNVGLAAQGLHPGAGDADIPQQELDDAHRADILDPDGMLGPPHCVENVSRPVGLAGGGVKLVDLQQLVLRRSGHPGHKFRRVAGVVSLEELVNAVRVLQGRILPDRPGGVGLIGPGRLVVFSVLESGKDPIVVSRQLESRIDQKRGVRIVPDVLFLDQVVVEDVFDHPAQKRDVRPRTERGVKVGLRRRLREPGIDADQFCPLIHRLRDPLERDGMVRCGVAPHD